MQGDLQTATRESVSDRKRVEVEKAKTKLSQVVSDAKADRRVESNKMQNKVKLEAERLRREADCLGQALEE